METITRLNGNGDPFTLPLPEIWIWASFINDGALAHIRTNAGLDFRLTYVGCSVVYRAQPVRSQQIVKLMLLYRFSTLYVNNIDFENVLFLKFAEHCTIGEWTILEKSKKS